MNEQLLQKVLSCSKLPTLPTIAVQVIEMTSDENVSMGELAKVIEFDQGLATKILKTVNSAFYGLPKQCSTLSHAQSLLGLDAVKTLALSFSLVKTLQSDCDDNFDYERYWQRAIYSAVAAKAIATMVRCGDAEESFLGALLQDLGMIALAKALEDDYIAIVQECDADHRSLTKREIAEFELQHPDVGAMIAERWRLPEALIMPIKYHERPTAAPAICRDLVRCVAIGNVVADILIQDDRAYWLTQFYQRSNQWFGLTPTQADEIIETVTKNARDVARLFEIPMGATPKTDDILELASERLAAIALQENRNAIESAAATDEARRALETDSLTGLGTRTRFMDQVAALFDAACEQGKPLSVLLIDADRFRLVNDEYSPEAGDLAIIRLGQRLTSFFAQHEAEPHRYGGEEFAVALLGVDRRAASKLADDIRKEISQSPIDLMGAGGDKGDVVSLTASVGVATLDGDTQSVLTRPERLVYAADKAVHAAKDSNGNCVRVFLPKRRKAA